MKIIEGMKEIKRLEEKVGDLNKKISQYCTDWDFESPTYPDQKTQVTSWVQGVHDTLKEALAIRIRIQKTNIQTPVIIELGGLSVNHSIAEWIVRRRLYAKMEEQAWSSLNDRAQARLTYPSVTGEKKDFKARLYFDPIERDKKIEIFRSEIGIIDRTLEVINATTDLVE